MSNSCREVLYIDYEVAGFHSLVLDMAKPLYNDVYFNIFYADVLQIPQESTVSFDENRNIIIDFNFQRDSLSTAILDIKRRYLIAPLYEFVKRQNIELFDVNDIRQLGFAMFACAVLSRNFNGKWDVFFANLAVGLMLSQMETISELENIGKVHHQGEQRHNIYELTSWSG